MYIEFYGTGFRNARSFAALINGVAAPVTYAGAQPNVAGVDQVNIQIPSSMPVRGYASAVLEADGQVSNTVVIRLR